MFRNSQTNTLLTFFVLKNVTNICRPCLIRNSNANVSLQNVTIKPASKCTFVVFNNLKNLHFMRKISNYTNKMKSLGDGQITQKLVFKEFVMKTRCVFTDGIQIKNSFLSVSNFLRIFKK